jgi:hypothetical protein
MSGRRTANSDAVELASDAATGTYCLAPAKCCRLFSDLSSANLASSFGENETSVVQY